MNLNVEIAFTPEALAARGTSANTDFPISGMPVFPQVGDQIALAAPGGGVLVHPVVERTFIIGPSKSVLIIMMGVGRDLDKVSPA